MDDDSVHALKACKNYVYVLWFQRRKKATKDINLASTYQLLLLYINCILLVVFIFGSVDRSSNLLLRGVRMYRQVEYKTS